MAADAAAHRGAPRAAATYLRRALAEPPAEQDRGEILADLGRYEVATMQFEAAEKHLRAALASGATLSTRADAASWMGRCAIVSGGRSAGAAAGQPGGATLDWSAAQDFQIRAHYLVMPPPGPPELAGCDAAAAGSQVQV